MLFGIAVYGREKVKSRPVGDQLALQVKDRVTDRHAKVLMDFIIRTHGPDPLLAAFHLYLEGFP